MMQFTIAKGALVSLLSAAASAAASKSPLQGYTMVLLDASGSLLRARSTDGYVGVDTSAEAAVKAPGSCAVEARAAFDLAKALPDGDVTVKATADHVEFKSGKAAKFKVKTFPVANMPPAPELGATTPVGDVPAADLLRAVKAGSYARDTDESRPQSTVLIHACGSDLRVVSACNRGMAVATVVTECAELELVMSSRGLGELSRLCESHSDESVAISAYGPTAVFTAGSTTLWSRMREEKFPPYGRLLVSCKGKHSTHVNRDALLDAAKRAAMVAGRGKDGAVIDLSFNPDGKLGVSSSAGGNDAFDIVDCDANFAVTLAVNPDQLLAALGVAHDDEIEAECTDEKAPLLLRSDGCVAVIMPRSKA